MIKRLCSIFMIIVICICSFSISAYAEDESLRVNLSVNAYDSDGNVSDTVNFGSVYLPHGVQHELQYDSIVDASAVITYVNSWTQINVSAKNRLPASYAYVIALINSCSTSTQSQISTSFEVETLQKFLYEKAQDPSDNYAFKSYIEACDILGAFLLYSPDYDLYEPTNSFIFNEWFDQMNKQFLEEWFVYYNQTLSEGNGYNWYIYLFESNKEYEYIAGERATVVFGNDVAVYRSERLNFGGAYTSDDYNLITAIVNLTSTISLPLMFAWLPSDMLAVVVTYLGMAMTLLMSLAVLKVMRG